MAAYKERPKHGFGKRGIKRIPEYSAWMDMRGRCFSKTHRFFQIYGGRGITVCKKWEDFSVFLSDMGKRPSKKHSLDRINVNGPYSQVNCRWADRETQNNNKQNTRLITWGGKTMSRAQWERNQGLTTGVLKHRLASGWGIGKAMTTPVGKGRPRQIECKRGHPLKDANVRVTSQGTRLCRECDKKRQRGRYRAAGC